MTDAHWTPERRDILRRALRKVQAAQVQGEKLVPTIAESTALADAAGAWEDMMQMLDRRALSGSNAEPSLRVQRLRRILHRYGDRVPMAMCHRPDWQQEIDEAMEWVANHPEKEG